MNGHFLYSKAKARGSILHITKNKIFKNKPYLRRIQNYKKKFTINKFQ